MPEASHLQSTKGARANGPRPPLLPAAVTSTSAWDSAAGRVGGAAVASPSALRLQRYAAPPLHTRESGRARPVQEELAVAAWAPHAIGRNGGAAARQAAGAEGMLDGTLGHGWGTL